MGTDVSTELKRSSIEHADRLFTHRAVDNYSA
jgi:hypothetical protein